MASGTDGLVFRQGYETEIFVDQNLERILCAICKNVLRNAHQCRNGHCICWECWQLSLKTKKSCPVCRVDVDESCLSPNLFATESIEMLQVKCIGSNLKGGRCDWIGKLGDRESHILDCIHLKDIVCPFYQKGSCVPQCNGKITRRALHSHNEGCIGLTHLTGNCLQHLQASIAGGFLQFTCLSQFSYTGDQKDGMKDGKGKWESLDGKSFYNGEWFEDKRHGKGVQIYPDWSYNGEWSDDKMHGYCFGEIRPSGTYVGSYQNNERSGRGTFTSTCGSVYSGQWLHGKKCGIGLLEDSELDGGTVYTGAFVDGKIQGEGVLKSQSMTYEGMFKHGQFHGEGRLQNSDGTVYSGMFQDGKYHGKGILSVLSEGKKTFRGEFRLGLKHGQMEVETIERNGDCLYRKRLFSTYEDDIEMGI